MAVKKNCLFQDFLSLSLAFFQQLKCCGLTGLSEFASKLDPIDQSCYYQRQMETDSKYKFSSLSLSSYEPYRVST